MFDFFKKKPSAEPVDKIATLNAGDATLRDFKKEAQDGIQYLIDFMGSHAKDDELFKYAVKTGFSENGKSEHMWVQVNEYKKGIFYGKLVNNPNTMKLLKYGDPVTVRREDVDDWILKDDLTGTKVGGFSSSYLRNKADEKKSEE